MIKISTRDVTTLPNRNAPREDMFASVHDSNEVRQGNKQEDLSNTGFAPMKPLNQDLKNIIDDGPLTVIKKKRLTKAQRLLLDERNPAVKH